MLIIVWAVQDWKRIVKDVPRLSTLVHQKQTCFTSGKSLDLKRDNIDTVQHTHKIAKGLDGEISYYATMYSFMNKIFFIIKKNYVQNSKNWYILKSQYA